MGKISLAKAAKEWLAAEKNNTQAGKPLQVGVKTTTTTTAAPTVQRPVAQRVQEWITNRKSELQTQISSYESALEKLRGAPTVAARLQNELNRTGVSGTTSFNPLGGVTAKADVYGAAKAKQGGIEELERELANLRYDLQELEDPVKAELMAWGAIKEEDRRARKKQAIAAESDASQNAGYLLSSFAGGMSDFAGGFYNAADAITPSRTKDGERISKPRIDAWKKMKEEEEFIISAYGAEVSPAMQKYGGMIARGVGYTLPSTVLAMLPGVQALSASAGGNVLANPQFWFSAIPMYGNGYAEAKEQGATEQEAQWFAALNAFAGATVEIGGGVQKIPTQKSGLLTWIRGALEEGGEEVLQGIIEQASKSVTYEKNKKIASWDDPDAIISGKRALQEFGSGTLIGGLLGGGQVLAGMAVDAASAAQMYEKAPKNKRILDMIQKVKDSKHKQNETISLGVVSPVNAERIQAITGIDVAGWAVAIEARQIEHILKDHGATGKADHSMVNPDDIAKMEYALATAEEIADGGTTKAYSSNVDGKNRLAKTVLYQKNIGDRYYYVVEAVPDTKKKTLQIVSTYINKNKKIEGSHPIDTKGPDVTPKSAGAMPSGNRVTQTAPVVNTHSMQSGDGYAQNAFLPEDQFVDRMGVDGQSPRPSGAPPFTQGGHAADAATGAMKIDEGAVLESAVRSQLQGRPTAQATDIDGIIAELGEETVLRRMWSATQIDRPTGTVEIDGQRVSAEAYMDAYEEALPDDPAALQEHIRGLEQQRAEAIVQMEREGTLDKYRSVPLSLDLQLFAAKRKLELYVPEGENGTKDRRFLWQRTRGLDANKAHEAELIKYLAGRSETYNPISNQQTLDDAKENMGHWGYMEELIKRLEKDDKRDLFNEVEVAAVMIMINNARNDGDLETYADLVQLLSRKGTAAGRAVQIYALQAKLTPEGTIRHGHRVLREETDHVHGKGTSAAIDMVADDVVKNVEQELQAEASRPYLPEFEEDADFAASIDGWENRNDEGYITVGNVPGGSPLQQVGIPAGKMYFDLSKLKKAMGDHADHLSPDVLKQIPSLLKKPIVIVEYKPGEGTNTVNVYGELYHKGKPIMVSVVVTTGRDGSVISKIRTIHARRDYAGKITDDSTLYLWDNKEETDAWFQALNLPVPMGGTTYGLIRSIARPFGSSDIQKGTATQTQARGQRVPTREQDNGSKESVPQVKGGVKREKKPFDPERAQKILDKVIQDKITDAPQLKKWLTRKDIRLELSRRIAKLVEDGALTNTAMQKTFREVLELPQLTTEDLGELIRLVNEMNAAEIGSAQQAEAEEAIYRLLGSKLPSTRMEKWQSWRKLAMLANPKTHIRNAGSNLVNNQVVGRIDTAVRTVLQRIFMKPEARTAYLGWSFTNHGRSIRSALDKAADAAAARMRLGQGKYDIGTAKISRYKRPFGPELLNNINDWNSGAMEGADAITFRNAYRDALGQYMTARGLTEVTKEADEIAFKRAEETTFRASNAINDVMMTIKKFARSDKKTLRLFGHFFDVVIPFTKTPANIAVASFEHSPLGLVKGAFELVQRARGKSAATTAEIINDFAKGITGSALLAIGLLLGHLGLFNTGFGKTEKERAADELAGLQENAFVFGDVSISFDWLQPAASPLIVGASIGKRLADEDMNLGAVFGAVMDGTDSLFEMTMLQSLYDILGGYDAGATATAASIAENAVSQSIPTLLGQAARAIDPVQRKTTADNEFMTIVNQVVAKIPGLTYILDPELDVWGDEVYRTGKPGAGTAALNAIQQFILPSNVKVGTGRGDRTSAEILRLYRSQGSKAVPGAVSRDDAKDGGMDHVEINRRLGQVNRQAVEDFINNQWPYAVQVDAGNGKTKKETKYYRNMTDEERVRVLSRIYTNTKKAVTDPTSDEAADPYFKELFGRLR